MRLTDLVAPRGFVPVLMLALVALIGESAAVFVSRESPSAAPRVGGPSPVPPTFRAQDELPVAEIDRRANFAVYHPALSLANDSNVTHSYLIGQAPGAREAVALFYPLLSPMATGVRQGDLGVFEQRWTFGDADTLFKEDLSALADPDAYRCDFSDVPALCVPANAASDATQQNPAYLHLDVAGVSVELTGGNDIQTLIQIAHSLTEGS